MAFLRGFGSYLPERIVNNDELAHLCGVDAEWIFSASGIRERRYAADDESVASLGIHAAKDCLQRCGMSASEISMVIAASGSPGRYCPGPAASIAHGLGLSTTPALDIPVASAGSLIALAMAEQFAASAGPILVIGSEVMSRRVERTPEGKNTAILFGDGAGAAIVDPEQGFARIMGHALHTDGSATEFLAIEDGRLHMDGAVVIRHVGQKLPAVIREILDRHTVPPEQVGAAILHQANVNLIQRAAKVSGIPYERFFVNIDRCGNTSSASMLIAAAEWSVQDAARTSGHLLFAAFGAGLNWGALLAGPSFHLGAR